VHIYDTIISAEIRHPTHVTQYVGTKQLFARACYLATAQQVYVTSYDRDEKFLGLDFLNGLKFDLPLAVTEMIHQYGNILSNYGTISLVESNYTIRLLIMLSVSIRSPGTLAKNDNSLIDHFYWDSELEAHKLDALFDPETEEFLEKIPIWGEECNEYIQKLLDKEYQKLGDDGLAFYVPNNIKPSN